MTLSATFHTLVGVWQLVILLYFIVLNSTYTAFILISAWYIIRHKLTGSPYNIRSVLCDEFYRPLTIVVPAYNEEGTIVASVQSLLNLHYPEFEVVVVSDGSTDRTLEELTGAFRLMPVDKPVRLQLPHAKIRRVFLSLDHPNLTVIDKANGGKGDAINAGINASRFPLFCCLDADSVLENDAVLRATRLFVEDRAVIASGGIVRIMNGCRVENGTVTEIRSPSRLLEAFQSVEYIRGFLSGRTAWNLFNGLLIISGAFGIFRKDMVLAVGGYRHTVGEDMDLVIRLHRHCLENNIPYRIVFIPDPVCFTQGPSDFRSLLKQRNRWQRGLVECLFYSRRLCLNPRYGTVGLFAYPYYLFAEALGPIIEFSGYLSFILFYVLGLINGTMALLFLMVAVLWGIWLNIASIILDNILFKRYKSLSDVLKLSLLGILELVGYRQILTIERLRATFQFRQKGWGTIVRQKIAVRSEDA